MFVFCLFFKNRIYSLLPVLDTLLLFKKLPDFFFNSRQLEKRIFFIDEKRWPSLPYGLWSQFSLPFFVSPKWCHVLFCLILHIYTKLKHLELYSKQVNCLKKLLWLPPTSFFTALLVSQLNMKHRGKTQCVPSHTLAPIVCVYNTFMF